MNYPTPFPATDRVPDHLLGRVCIGIGVGVAILGQGHFPSLGDLADGVPRFLMTRRGHLRTTPGGPGVRNEPGLWDFPGGGIEFGEDLETAVCREVAEELGLRLDSVRHLGHLEHVLRDAAGRAQEHWISHTHLAYIEPDSPIPSVPEAERTKLVELRYFTTTQIRDLPVTQLMPRNLSLLTQVTPQLCA